MPSSKPVASGSMRSLFVLIASYGFCFYLAGATRVSVYTSETTDVLNHNWDGSADKLVLQLEMQGFDVSKATEGQPKFSADEVAPAAYVVPTQNGPVLYSSAEDMGAVATYLSAGGLVVLLHSSSHQDEALRQFVTKAFGYEGDWSSCKPVGSNEAGAVGQLALSSGARDFLPETKDAWPAALENARITTTYSLCRNSDSSATTVPLYSVNGEDGQIAAQAFGKVGVPGAIVWLGYGWQDGPQPMWGSLLAKLINDFAAGTYEEPEEPAEADDALDGVLEAVTDKAADTAEIVRRFLQSSAGTYPSPPSSPNAIGFLTPPNPAGQLPEPPSDAAPPLEPFTNEPPVPPPPPPKRGKQPPPPPASVATFFQSIPAMGSPSKSRSLVWYDDADFRDQLKARSPVQLIYRKKAPCQRRCGNCNRAWKATNISESIALFFKDPVQLSSITIKQVKNPNLIIVQLLNWKTYPTGRYSAEDIGATIYNSTQRLPCGSDLTIDIPARVSGINQVPPPNADPANLPANLRVAQGVVITMYRPPNAGRAYGPFVEYVKFSGRALYARSPAEYTV